MTDWPNFKAFVDNNLNVAKMVKLAFDRVENIAGKGENASHQHFLLFPQCLPKSTFLGSLKVGDCVLKGYRKSQQFCHLALNSLPHNPDF